MLFISECVIPFQISNKQKLFFEREAEVFSCFLSLAFFFRFLCLFFEDFQFLFLRSVNQGWALAIEISLLIQVSCTLVIRNCLCFFIPHDFMLLCPHLCTSYLSHSFPCVMYNLPPTRQMSFLNDEILLILQTYFKYHLLYKAFNALCQSFFSQAKVIILFSILPSIMYILIGYLHICVDIK